MVCRAPVTRMRSVTRLSAAPAPSALRLLGLLVVVAGLFGMHGLASHGVDGMDVVPGTAMTAQSMTASLMSIDAPPVGVGAEEMAAIERPQSLESNKSGHGGMDMSIAMMCVAILGAALLFLARRLRGERSFWVIAARRHHARLILHPGRGPTPPLLMELSIQRC